MNTDCTRPSVAPTPRFVCHASLKLPSPLTSASRGPKPSVAPKPKVNVASNGNLEGFSNGRATTSDGEGCEAIVKQNGLNKVIMNLSTGKKHLNISRLKFVKTDLETMLKGTEDSGGTEEEKEEDESQNVDEDCRLRDNTLREEGYSPKTLWVSDDRLTADSEVTEEMIDSDDMDAEGCDGGEALADTDGLSMGSISVHSAEDGLCYHSALKHESIQTNGDKSTTNDLSKSSTEENGICVRDRMMDTDAKHGREQESGPDLCFKSQKIMCVHQIKEKEENLQVDGLCHIYSTKHKQVCHGDIEPFYISSDDIVNMEASLSEGGITPVNVTGVSIRKYIGTAEDGHLMDCVNFDKDEEYVNKDKVMEMKDVLNYLDNQARLRHVAISVPTDTDTSLTSSFSESQLLSPNDSDVFKDEEDMDGHIVPFLDETIDMEHNVTDEHVYEEPGKSSCAESGTALDGCAGSVRTRSLSHWTTAAVGDRGVQFLHKTYVSGLGQPVLSSSPVLDSTRHKSYSKPKYLSLYPRSLSMEGHHTPLCIYKEGSYRHRDGISSSESFSKCSPLSSSALSTPTSLMDIPPPFELSFITKKPITKSSPSLLTRDDSAEKDRKKKSSIKRFLLKFGWKTDSKSGVDTKPSSLKSLAEVPDCTPNRLLNLDRQSISGSPQLNLRPANKPQGSPEPSSTFLFYKEGKRKGNSAFLNRSVIRVESFEDRSRVPFAPLPLTKPRSISFPNTDTSDYENVPPLSSDYENVQVPQRRPVQQMPLTNFFNHPSRVLSTANETDGYVDMKSLPGFETKQNLPEQETESAYTEAYNVCAVAAGAVSDCQRETVGDEDQGRTSEEEDGGTDVNYERQTDGRSRAFYIVKELVDKERLHVEALRLLQKDFRKAVGSAVGDDGQPVLDDDRLREILNELPDIYMLHRKILTDLESRIRHWEDSQRIADIFLSRKAEFLVFTTYIGHYDRSISLLEDSCRASPAFAAIVQKFEEQSPVGEKVSFKNQLLQVIVRVAQYRLLLTDYLNNLSPDSKEYEDTQAAVAIMSDISDQVNDSLIQGENLLRLINIAYSVRGSRDLLHPGRVFLKEGTLMKVSRKSHQPRHLFLMNDILLYTYPQQDGKYRLKNTLPLNGLKVSKPNIPNVQNALKIEGSDISIVLSASSFLEREDWYYTLNRTVTERERGPVALNSNSGETRDRLWLSLGEKAPTLVPVSQVMMCMNCTADFSLTVRRHHCHSCGRIVCRSCSRNRYPLKYMKNRMAKVCDHCYSELKNRGGEMSEASGKDSPRLSRSSRPLSTVFQSIHPPNIWRHRKGTASFTQPTVSEEGSISGSLQRSKTSKRNWKKLWFLLKDKVLYTYRAQEEKVASESLPLLGFTVKLPDQQGGDAVSNIFQLYHQNTLYYTFKAEDNLTAQRWVNAMEEATNL
ncbi:PREDICTED: FYVE, RhoGEF and PH domain-containing protein 5-like isoform X1 [Cyprinodon variegatus]|uniref:FYVE, RhoGEF and PH domain-containing protein 5-like isoform X1 n=1 Tax=Cyprinodon variegatus TaxID=28743 RepID=UPI00074290F8|nr:PREDICTED: FYVE, RhoGEF and PH domain-containing protein 5-like isoform X1 [Cyprinodon variegatus]